MCVITYALQYVQCPEGWKCVKVYDGEYLENFGVYFGELAGSWLLVEFTVGLVLSIAVSVPIAVSVSKSINPVSRALADVCRTVYIWVFGIVMTVSIGV